MNDAAPAGAQADQFLHAFCYERTFNGRKANYEAHFEQNKSRKVDALADTMAWWRSLPEAPGSEDQMLNVTAPALRATLAEPRLATMTYKDFRDVCMGVHAIMDYARRVPNKSVNLPDDGTRYTIPQRVDAPSKRIWNDQGSNGQRVTGLLQHALYGGTNQLPE